MNREGEILSKDNFEKAIQYIGTIENKSILEKNKKTISETGTCGDITNFIKELYDNNWLINTRWQDWTGEAEIYLGNPEMIDTADVETIRKLLTVHVRIDRLFPGNIVDLIDNGHILRILKRIREINS